MMMSIERDPAKRAIAAARGLTTFMRTRALGPQDAATDSDTGLQLLERLERATEELARATYASSPIKE
jgi:hypothetical protein